MPQTRVRCRFAGAHTVLKAHSGNAVVSAAASARDQAVRWAIEPLYAQGMTLRAIADKLNERKVLPARGDTWHASAVGNTVSCLGLTRE